MEPVTVPKRAAKRSRVFLAAQVDAGAGLLDAHIRDISRSGALVEADVALQPGHRIELNCGKTKLSAHVAWAHSGWFGVKFDTPLMMSRLVDDAGTRLKVSAPRTYRSADVLD